MPHRNGDAPEVLGRQATFVGDCTDDGTRADILALADVQPVRLKVTIRPLGAAAVLAATLEVAVALAVIAIAAVLLWLGQRLVFQ